MDLTADHYLIQQKKIWVEHIGPPISSHSPTLVFLHEGLGSTRLWKDFPELLCRKMMLPGVVYDRQGHGLSEAATERRKLNYLHVEAMEFLPELLDELEIRNPILVGHSDGGTIALIYAAHYPVKALVTIAAHVYFEPSAESGIRKTIARYAEGSLRKQLEKYHGEQTDALFSAWAETWLADWFSDWNIEYLLNDIDCPVLSLQGSMDEYADPDHLKAITNGIGPESLSELLPGLGHSPHLENPELVLVRVSKFLDKV